MDSSGWTGSEPRHVRREVLTVIAASNTVAAAVLGIAIVAWMRGSGAWFAAFVVAYVCMCFGVAVTAGIPRRRQQERDHAWAERFRDLAIHDELSGLHNRRYFNAALDEAIGEAARGDRTLRLVLLDLNGFKRINDTLGHAAGDLAIRISAAALSGALDGEVLVARMGGDEFALLVEGRNELDDTRLAGCVERALQAAPFVVGGHDDVRISAAIGVARFQPGMDAPALLRSADHQLYAEKAKLSSRRKSATPRRDALA